MRQFRGHSIPVENRTLHGVRSGNKQAAPRIDGNKNEPKIITLLAMEFAQTALFGLMTPTKARLW